MSDPDDSSRDENQTSPSEPDIDTHNRPSTLTIVLWIVLGIPVALVILALLVLGVCFIGLN